VGPLSLSRKQPCRPRAFIRSVSLSLRGPSASSEAAAPVFEGARPLFRPQGVAREVPPLCVEGGRL
jgi:hypothetical protein